MEQTLKNIQLQLNRIEEKITNLEEKISKVDSDCSKMNSHINFVEQTYAVVRTPLNYLKTKVDILMGNNNIDPELPLIKNNSE